MNEKKPKPNHPQDADLVDYIIAHPELSEYACILACGWRKGSEGKVMKRIRGAVDARKAENSAKIDKKIVKELTRFDALRELADMAQDWRNSEDGVQMCHVRAAELYLHISGETPEAKKITADIQSRLPGGNSPVDDFRPDWAKAPSVN